MFSNPEVAKSSNEFYCNFCDYRSSKLFNYKKHTATSKHKIAMVSNQNAENVAKSSTSKQYMCQNCNKIYKDMETQKNV